MDEIENTINFEQYLINDLKTNEEIKLYLNASLNDYIKDGDLNSFSRALEIAIKAKGTVSEFAKKTGISRAHLYNLFKNEKEPKFTTIVKIFQELGFNIEIA